MEIMSSETSPTYKQRNRRDFYLFP